ncbi:MAG: hypothetical protein BWY72_02066 [Bacteroidetes bacterium ADurb.Bin416]|nr:MAG: hypothetical protein BWY72_02066 [Bacteroidetes bacterium ADurb.Bin416]
MFHDVIGCATQTFHVEYIANQTNHILSDDFEFGHPGIQRFLTDIHRNHLGSSGHKMLSHTPT